MGYDILRRACNEQALANKALNAGFSALVLEAAAEGLGNGGPLDALLAPWAGASFEQVTADAVPLRLLAGFHDLVLAGLAPALAADYPGHGAAAADPARLREQLRAAAARHGAHLGRFLASPPQTNEAARSFCLFGGFLTVAAQTGLPLRCLELGASAGLNQIWDRFRYDLGEGGAWGDPASPVRLAGAWSGAAPPLDAEVRVVERRACDQAPIDLADPAAARRLVSYVWAEQAERLRRVRAAIALARDAGVRVEAADAGEWAERHASPQPGTATVLYHSVFWQYPPPATQDRMARAVAAAGAAATAAAPFAWLRMEPVAASGPVSGYSFEVTLTLWPGGETRRLAVVHPHGAWVRWG
ncbi:MAG: hypothetical protein B7Y99_05770 [Caulobacterales bacterium 32-69-10]|nr:MAG: hypothetical protein B7Y99_05770 [Caulobacterales bacterium 32-69-10]